MQLCNDYYLTAHLLTWWWLCMIRNWLLNSKDQLTSSEYFWRIFSYLNLCSNYDNYVTLHALFTFLQGGGGEWLYCFLTTFLDTLHETLWPYTVTRESFESLVLISKGHQSHLKKRGRGKDQTPVKDIYRSLTLSYVSFVVAFICFSKLSWYFVSNCVIFRSCIAGRVEGSPSSLRDLEGHQKLLSFLFPFKIGNV